MQNRKVWPWISVVIRFRQNQIDGLWWPRWTNATWQPGFEEGAEVAIGTEGQPNVDAAIRDRECTKSILDRVQLVFGDAVLFEKFDVFIVIHQLHCTTIPEEARVIREDIASHLIACYIWLQ